MKVTRGLETYAKAIHPVVTIGNFDGQHRGHRALLQMVVETAHQMNGTAMVLTFDPHPVRVLAPHVELRFLTSGDQKLHCFEEAGIQEVLFLEFNTAFASLPADQFVTQVLKEGIGVKDLYVGEHFKFGKGRAGTIADLQRMGNRLDFRVHPVRPFRVDGVVVSSTHIRQLVQAGEMQKAGRFLGRPYSLTGTVVCGDRRGRTIGWPTANLRLPPDRVIPSDGVYATRTVVNGQSFESVAYIGTRPTFGQTERLLEVYFLDQQIELYGETIIVQFVERLRGDQTFASAEELSARIDLDVSQARASLRGAAQAVLDV
ncbi:MAG: bifunctional riboflavin kinase/FAD synthetase [Nitrospiraceae bacterium]